VGDWSRFGEREFERRRARRRTVQLRATERAHELARKTYYGRNAMTETDAMGEARRRLDALFPTRFDHMMFQLQHYAQTLQRFDVTFFDREPILEVSFDKGFARKLCAALRSKDAPRAATLLERLTFSNGTTASGDAVWTINYMPPGGITVAQLEGADLALAESRAGPRGETVREMIRATYRCSSAAEEDWFVRRWIAS
jgi:hypothetical protein